MGEILLLQLVNVALHETMSVYQCNALFSQCNIHVLTSDQEVYSVDLEGK